MTWGSSKATHWALGWSLSADTEGNVSVTFHCFFITLTGFSFSPGILSLLECKKSTSACACATLIHTPERESEDIEESESSVKIVSLPENAAAPRSIVHTREGSPNRPQLQTRRVTWAL